MFFHERVVRLFKFQIEGKKGVWLNEHDIKLLQLLYDYKALALYQIHYYYYRANGLKKNSVNKKLIRWKEKSVVHASPYSKAPGQKIYYRLGAEGARLLENTTNYSNLKITPVDLTLRKNTDHFFAIRDVILQTQLLIKGWRVETDSENPIFSSAIIPDWILRLKDRTVCIEVDTGSENLSYFKSKIQKYGAYARQDPSEHLNVLVVVIDDAHPDIKLKNKYPKDRSKRILNLKNAIIATKVHTAAHVNFYVVPLSRAALVAEKLLTGSYPYDQTKRYKLGHFPRMTLNLHDAYQTEELNATDFYLPGVSDSLYGDGHFVAWNRKDEMTVIVKVLEEGNVRSLDGFAYLDLLYKEKRLKRPVDFVLGFYKREDEMNHDVLGERSEEVRVSHVLNWGVHQKIPIVYRMRKNSRLERVDFHNSYSFYF